MTISRAETRLPLRQSGHAPSSRRRSPRARRLIPVSPAIAAVVLFFPAPSVRGAAPATTCVEASRVSMACTWVVKPCGADPAALRVVAEEALDEVDRIDRLMSHYRPDSALSNLNRDAAAGPVKVERELFDLIAESLRYSRETDAAFDITVGPLMKAWGFFDGEGRVPDERELQEALAVVGARHVILDPATGTVRFDRPGVALDLGGIAKGYAVDQVVKILRRRQISSALVNGGQSSIFGLGAPPGGEAWEVEVLDPGVRGRRALSVSLRDRALSVSGRAGRQFVRDGVVYGHIMDPRRGAPVQGVLGVAVLSDTATSGDALCDAFFVQGPAWTRRYVAENSSVAAYLFLPGSEEASRVLPLGR